MVALDSRMMPRNGRVREAQPSKGYSHRATWPRSETFASKLSFWIPETRLRSKTQLRKQKQVTQKSGLSLTPTSTKNVTSLFVRLSAGPIRPGTSLTQPSRRDYSLGANVSVSGRGRRRAGDQSVGVVAACFWQNEASRQACLVLSWPHPSTILHAAGCASGPMSRIRESQHTALPGCRTALKQYDAPRR